MTQLSSSSRGRIAASFRVVATTLAATSLVATVAAQQWRRASPPAQGRLAFDPISSRMLLVGGRSGGAAGATWSFDGASWRDTAIPDLPVSTAEIRPFWNLAQSRLQLVVRDLVAPIRVWEFDGSSWNPLPAAGPSARMGFATVQDVARGRIVLFGGQGLLGNLDETWEYDGVTWTQRQPAQSPPARHSAAMAYDLTRGRAVLFGGAGVQEQVLGDTWEWDGVSWSQNTAGIGPSARVTEMAYDIARSRVVLFGGTANAGLTSFFADTWEYDGVRWSQASPANAPAARAQVAMDFDWNRGVVVLHGGRSPGTSWFTNIWNDTWEYDGVDWVRPAPAPPARQDTALLFDPSQRRLICFGGGGADSFELLDDTWRFDGTDWRQQPLALRPLRRAGHEMCFDTRRQRALLFGGRAPGSLNDLWSLQGSSWAPIATSTRPPVRHYHSMVYDAARDRAVLFGGIGGPHEDELGDTWVFDGADWAPVAPAIAPSPRMRAAMTYDVARDRVVLHGGFDNGVAGADTWEFDGATWSAVTSAARPPAWHWIDMVYDPLRGRSVLVGHETSTAGVWYFDGAWSAASMVDVPIGTLAFDTTRAATVLIGASELVRPTELWALAEPGASFARYGAGCAGGGTAPTLDAAGGALPTLGSAFALQLGGLPAAAGALYLGFGVDPLHAGALPVPLDAAGLPGCLLWTTVDFGVFQLHPGGAAAVSLPIPADPRLDGLTIGAQALAFDAAAPGGVGRTTNGALLRLR
ncbi:MAG: kelch repeat-containing protein [Planctomycetota bacterium]